MKRTILLATSLLAFLIAGATSVLADQAYHSERLDFALTADGASAGHPILRHGQVVNIHPNGPVNGALERYMVSGAKPDTSYDVRLDAYFGDCVGEPVLSAVPDTLDTNGKGVAHGQGFFSPADLAGASGLTLRAQWTLNEVVEDVDAYQTDCTTVVID